MQNKEKYVYIPEYLKYVEPIIESSIQERSCVTLNACCQGGCHVGEGCGECGGSYGCGSCYSCDACESGCEPCYTCVSCQAACESCLACTTKQCESMNIDGCCSERCVMNVGEPCGACVLCVACVSEGCGEGCGEGCSSCYVNQCNTCVIYQGGQLATPTIRGGAISASTVEILWSSVPNADEAIMERKLTASSSWSGDGYATSTVSFGNLKATWNALKPNTSYDFRIKAHQKGTTYQDSNWSNVLTIKTSLKPGDFIWKIQPQTGNYFDETVTAVDWRNLQDTINGWRGVAGVTLFAFYGTFNGEGSFTLPVKNAAFDVMYFWQVLNAIKTIPKFNGTLPIKPNRGDICKASDFKMLEAAVNSLKNVY